MITKTNYFFTNTNHSFESSPKDTIEEIRKDIVDYKKENIDDNLLIYKHEINHIFDKKGILVYSSDTIMREFDNDNFEQFYNEVEE